MESDSDGSQHAVHLLPHTFSQYQGNTFNALNIHRVRKHTENSINSSEDLTENQVSCDCMFSKCIAWILQKITRVAI